MEKETKQLNLMPAIMAQWIIFTLLLALLPVMAMIIGLIVLWQVPNAVDVIGVLLVGVAVHKPSKI